MPQVAVHAILLFINYPAYYKAGEKLTQWIGVSFSVNYQMSNAILYRLELLLTSSVILQNRKFGILYSMRAFVWFYGNTTTVTWLFCNAKQFTCLAQMTMLKYAMTNIFTNHIPSCLGTHWSWWLVKQYWLPSVLDVLYLYARTWWAQVAN